MVDMTQRLERLQQLLTLKERTTNQAYQALLSAKSQYEYTKTREDQLALYKKDYLQQVENLGHQGGNMGPLRNRIDFICQLDALLLQLKSHLVELNKQHLRHEATYLQKKAEQEVVEKLIARVQKLENNQIQRIEQKENDGYGQKKWYTTKNSVNTHQETYTPSEYMD
jgi:flagellar protein FliJ